MGEKRINPKFNVHEKYKEVNIINSYRFGGASAPILDTYTNSTCCYSLRLLKTGVTYLVRVQRNSDNASTDVEPYLNGDSLDLNSVVSVGGTLGDWVGVNSATVTVWYDQSGQGFNMGAVNNSPILIDSGTLQTKNGKSAVKFTTSKLMSISGSNSDFNTGNDFSFFWVASLETTDIGNIIATHSTNFGVTMYNDRRTQKRLSIIWSSVTTYICNLLAQNNTSDIVISASIVDGSGLLLSGWRNGSAQDQNVAWTGTYLNTSLYLSGGTNPIDDGYVQEVLGFSDKKTSDVSNIQTDINSHYSAY